MRFSVNTATQFPPPASPIPPGWFKNIAINKSERRSITEDSGHYIIVIPGDKNLSVILHQLYVTWGGIEQAGRIEIRSPESPPLVIYQTVPGGNIIIPCHDESIFLDRYGLRAANNSIGGEYSITAHYTRRVT